MLKHKRLCSRIMLAAMLVGLIPYQQVYAADYAIYGDNLDVLTDDVRNTNFEVNSVDLDTEEAHLDNYAQRFKGLAGMAATGPDVSNGDFDNVIAVTDANTTFDAASNLSEVKIGTNTVPVSYDAADIQFLDREDVAAVVSNDSQHIRRFRDAIIEYVYYADTYRKSLNNMLNNGNLLSGDDVNALQELYEVYKWCQNKDDTGAGSLPHVEMIISLWETKGEDGDLGLCELYDKSKQPNFVDTISPGITAPLYGQPLNMFYNVNENGSIVEVNIEDLSSSSGASRSTVSLSDNIIEGITYSSGYIPMQTNLYSTSTLNSYDQEWLEDFHYKYGFMRKALFMDTSSTAAMDYYNSRGTQKGNTRVCTLRDFLELGDKDLVLYIDTNFYNSDEAKEIVESKQATAWASFERFIEDLQTFHDTVFGKDETKVDSYVTNEYLMEVYNFDSTGFRSKRELRNELGKCKLLSNAFSKIDGWDSIVKTDTYRSYSQNMRQLIIDTDGEFVVNPDSTVEVPISYGLVADSKTIGDTLDGVTLRTEISPVDIEKGYEYTTYDEYTPLLSYAFVSAIYRSESAFKIASLNNLNTPVFIASDDVCQVNYATLYDRQSLLNYMLVRNLNSMVQINYTYSMDMDSPVYMDIYGNIVTQSGIVIIPAASNATLFPDDYPMQPYSAALFLCYGNDWHVPTSYENVEEVLGSYFYQDTDNGVWLIDGRGIQVSLTPMDVLGSALDTNSPALSTQGKVDFTQMSVYDENVYSALRSAFHSYIGSDGIGYTHVIWSKYVNIINEVMRGAPLEHINPIKENLNTNGVINRTSVVAAAKLEALIDSSHTDSANSLLAIPDFSSLEHSEYLIAFLFKFLIVLTVTVVLFAIYRDAVASNLGLGTIGKCLWSVFLTVMCLTSIPLLFQLTYYGANKMLLQKEVTKICMYNLEKEQSGIEIGVTKSDTPNTYNRLMVQLDYVDVEWYREINELMFGRGLSVVNEARERAARESQLSYLGDTVFYNDGVYMSVDDIYKSVGMDYTFNVGENSTVGTNNVAQGLYLYSNDTNQTLSFYSPYYVFLNALTSNVNQYNQQHNSYMYTTKQQSGNRVKTVGLCSNYFQSQGFMEYDEDILHLREVYGLDKTNFYDTGYCFYEDEIELMEMSRWYNRIDEKGLEKRLDIVNTYAREFVADNRELLDKVTDETFIKVMALSCAMKYNQVFGISEANCFEIYDMDSNDLLRLCLSASDDAMLTSPMSYARFVLTIGGESAVYAAAILEMVMYVGSFVKPICILVAYISVFLSIFVFRVMLRKKSHNLLGYLVTVCLLAFTNFFHAVIIKVSTYLPEIGLSMTGCIIFILIMQITYLMLLGHVTSVALRDWYNLGANHYEESLEALKRKRDSRKGNYLSGNVPRYADNWDYYNALVNQHRQRNDL